MGKVPDTCAECGIETENLHYCDCGRRTCTNCKCTCSGEKSGIPIRGWFGSIVEVAMSEAKESKTPLSPYQRIMRAANAGVGIRLSACEVAEMSMDDAISRLAANDDLNTEMEAQ